MSHLWKHFCILVCLFIEKGTREYCWDALRRQRVLGKEKRWYNLSYLNERRQNQKNISLGDFVGQSD